MKNIKKFPQIREKSNGIISYNWLHNFIFASDGLIIVLASKFKKK